MLAMTGEPRGAKGMTRGALPSALRQDRPGGPGIVSVAVVPPRAPAAKSGHGSGAAARMRRAGLTLVAWAAATAIVAAQAPTGGSVRAETYESATIDADGQLVIVKTHGERVVVRKAEGQTAFAAPRMSPARTAVAAQAMFRIGGVSYDVPLALVVYAAGREHRFRGVGLPIFQWGFSADGTRIAYGQEPTHFACAVHYELRDTRSGRLVDEIDVPQPCGENPSPVPVKVPGWVESLRASK